MAANQSARKRRSVILATYLADLTGFFLTVDCLTPDCKGERTYSLTEIAGVYGRDLTVAQAIQTMRCSCGARPGTAWLDVWPLKVRRERIALLGREG